MDPITTAFAAAWREAAAKALGDKAPRTPHHCGRCGCYFWFDREHRALTPAEEFAFRMAHAATAEAADRLVGVDYPPLMFLSPERADGS